MWDRFVPRLPRAPLPASSSLLVDDGDLVLPEPWSPPQRAPLPLVASIVPVVGAVVLWLVTGSMLALWLAALGPLIAIASVADGARAARSGRRRALIDADRAREDVSERLADRHRAERARRRQRHPDVRDYAERPSEVWRASPGRSGFVVLGTGSVDSGVRITGGDRDDRTAALKRRAVTLADAPVTVDVSAGVAVSGPAPLASAVVRGLVLQLCLAAPPGEVRILSSGRGETAWTTALVHRGSPGGLGVAVLGPDEPVPAEADVVIARVGDGGVAPPRCAALLTVRSPDSATFDDGARLRDLAVECIGESQARMVAADLADRADRVLGLQIRQTPVLLSDVLAAAPATRRGGLPAVLGVSGGEEITVDLVADGPHAVVAGVTGAGKSELLVSWVLALSATHATDEVTFLLADFKGGTAFDVLTGLPHVTGVITDLDGIGARRAVESLRAEVRWREGVLSRAGARDILDDRVALPRLVIVVDEFAALLGEHPELHAVFADVAARGRALGMHLVLGTQRVAGVVRDALLANCPLRISLRVTDAADSRGLIGTDDAARLPGGADGAGIAFVRRSQDAAPQRVRVALSNRSDVERIADAARGPAPRRPWLPELTSSVSLASLAGSATPGGLVLGLADDPERQRQEPVVLTIDDRGLVVVGGPGAGKTTALDTIAEQAPGRVIRVPRDGERAWDVVAELDERVPERGTVIVIDDLDVLLASLPVDYGQVLAERAERLVRAAGGAGLFFALSAQRVGAATGRIVDLVPRRLVLGAPGRADYVALGGDAAQHDPAAPPGRGRLAGRVVQVAVGETTAGERDSGQESGGQGGSGPESWGQGDRGQGGWGRSERGTPLPDRGMLEAVAAGAGDPISLAVPAPGITGLVARRAAGRAAAAAWALAGARVLSVGEAAAVAEADTLVREGPVVIVGDPDEWQRQWRLLAQVRDDHALVVDADCAAEFRLVAADRSTPPYCAPGRRRAWLIRRGGAPERVRLPDAPSGG